MIQILALNQSTAIRAKVIEARTGNEFFAGSKSMMIELLKSKMSNGVCHFLFIKKDGTVREAWGTLSHSLIEKFINGHGESRELYSTSAYFDIEKAAWRSFRWESIVHIL